MRREPARGPRGGALSGPAAESALAPHSLYEAVAALAADPALRPVAGCTDLMVADAVERAGLARVLDLLRIPEIRGVRPRGSGLEIGATTTMRELADDPQVRSGFPALARAAAEVGGWQIQNRATLGGNIANASPAGDTLPVLLALEAVAVAVGPRGEREIPYGEFHLGYRRTALAPGELLAWVRLPPPAPGTVQLFRKVGTRAAQAISKLMVALAGRVEAGRIAGLRLAAGSVAPTPVRLRAAEAVGTGAAPGPETAARVARAAAGEVEPIDDVRSTAAYRAWALERVVRRMMMELGR